MSKVIMGIGIPGSGKTTLLKSFAEKHNYAYICPDDIRLELTGDAADQTKNQEVWELAYQRVVDMIHTQESVVIDATFTHQGERQKFLDYIREEGATKVEGLYVNTPLEIAKERNAQRERQVPEEILDMMNDSITEHPPEMEEGFDALFVLDENQEMVSAEIYNAEKEIIHKEFKMDMR